MSRRSPTRSLTTVMFTDIVDSTRLATEMRDRRWRELITRHDRIVRREIRRFGGHEIGGSLDAVVAGEGYVWTLDALRGVVTTVDPRTGELGEPIDVSPNARFIARRCGRAHRPAGRSVGRPSERSHRDRHRAERPRGWPRRRVGRRRRRFPLPARSGHGRDDADRGRCPVGGGRGRSVDRNPLGDRRRHALTGSPSRPPEERSRSDRLVDAEAAELMTEMVTTGSLGGRSG